MTYALLATVRNEAPFLLEWLGYHRAIGFERVVVYSNDCTDGTHELLAALHEAGELVHVPHAPPPGAQIARRVGRHALESGVFETGDHVMWLDADEFLVVHEGEGRVADLAAAMGAHSAITVGWRLFGDAGHDLFGGAFLSPDYESCAAPGEGWRNVKTLFRMGPGIDRLHQHKPIFSAAFWQGGGTVASASGRPLAGGRFLDGWRSGEARGRIDEADAGWDLAQVNHYAVRSAPLLARKAERGRIGAANTPGSERYGPAYMRRMNRNEARDGAVLRWAAPAHAEAARLGAIAAAAAPGLAARIDAAYGPGLVRLADWYQGKTEDPPMPDAAALYRNVHKSHHEEMDERRYSNDRLAEEIVDIAGPGSIIDVGCGIGVLMERLEARGVEVQGVEGAWLREEDMACHPDRLIRADLERPLQLGRRYDAAVSIEVAEHLEPSRADGFVEDLCALSDVVIFSAAVGGQGGKGHKNEQWQSYWGARFAAQGYRAFDAVRPRFSRDAGIMPWFRQNILVYVRDGHPLCEALAADETGLDVMDMILPNYHRKAMNRMRKRLRARITAAAASSAAA